MLKTQIIFEQSPWLTLAAAGLGVAFALGLYWRSGSHPWPRPVHFILATLRGLLVFVLTLLLLEPLIRYLRTEYEAPRLVLAVDNSESVLKLSPSNQTATLAEGLALRTKNATWAGHQVDIVYLHGQSLSDTALSSNFDAFLQKIKHQYQGRHLGAVALLSDGVLTEGFSPEFRFYPFPIHTLALGDTTRRRDLAIRSVIHNPVSYAGNRFPVLVEAEQKGLEGQVTNLEVWQGSQLLLAERLELKAGRQLHPVRLELEAKGLGTRRYELRLKPLADEFTLDNNRKSFFIDVLQARDKVVLLAAAPHPDLKAISTTLGKHEHYELHQHILSTHFEEAALKKSLQQASLIILHHVPSGSFSERQLAALLPPDLPRFYFVGQSTLLGDYQQAAPPVQIQVAGRQSDVVFPALNPSFAKFALSAEEMATTVHDFPPVVVPYGRLSTATYAEVLLFQRVGNITTDRPLWALGEGPQRKQGVVLGDGIWQWRLDEYRQRESFEVFDQLLTKTIQYLAAKPDKRKFRVKPTQPEFDTRQAVIFETVMYNDLFEPVYGPAVELELRSDEGQRTQYAYSTSPSSTLYQVSGLSAGVYTYRARTTLDGKVLEDQGQLVVKDQNQEMDRLEANHELLRAVAQASGGQFAPGANWDQLEQWLTAQPTPLLAHSHEALDPLLNLWIVMAILLLWMSVEWFLRKFYGGY